MIYPPFIKPGQTIGLPAPSNGVKQKDRIVYENAIKTFNRFGYTLIPSQNNFNTNRYVSASAQERAKEFMDMWCNPDINALISLSGGEFLCEILPYLDVKALKKANPKFFQGFSDNTIINHMLLTWLDTANIYHYNFSVFGMKKWHSSMVDSYSLLTGKKLTFESFKKYQNERISGPGKELASFNLDTKSIWINTRNEEKITMQGRMVGGCLDVLLMFLGTPFDKTKDFIEKYNDDGFIWFLESCDLTVLDVKRALWKLKQAGWFKHVKGFVFGRPLVNETLNNITYQSAVMEILEELNVPVILNADIGHKFPTIPILNGSIANITCQNGKATISYKLL